MSHTFKFTDDDPGHNARAMANARREARRLARMTGEPFVVGWQTNDVTGELEPGYCPQSVAGPCFVHTTVETFR
jgi:hypothetical protein